MAAAPLTTTALYLAGGEKAGKFPKPSKEPSTLLVELLTLVGKERWEAGEGGEKMKVRKGNRIKQVSTHSRPVSEHEGEPCKGMTIV